MSLDTTVEIFLSTLLSAVAGSLIYGASQRPAERTGSGLVLRYGLPLRCLSVVVLVIVSGSLIFSNFDPKTSPEDTGLLVAGGVMTALFLYFFIEMFFVRIEFDEARISTFTPWRSSRQIPWSDIASFRHDEAHCWYIIQTRTHGTLRVSTFLSGINNFAERLRQNAIVFHYQEQKKK